MVAAHIHEKVANIVVHPPNSQQRKDKLESILNGMNDDTDKKEVEELIPRVDESLFRLINATGEILEIRKNDYKNSNDASKRIALDLKSLFGIQSEISNRWKEAYEKKYENNNQSGGKKSRKHNKKTVKKNNKKRHTKKRRTGKRRTGKRRTGKRRGRK